MSKIYANRHTNRHTNLLKINIVQLRHSKYIGMVNNPGKIIRKAAILHRVFGEVAFYLWLAHSIRQFIEARLVKTVHKYA